MKYPLMQHFIWVFNVCQKYLLHVIRIQNEKGVDNKVTDQTEWIHRLTCFSVVYMQQNQIFSQSQYGPPREMNPTLLHAKNKGADQPAHLCSLVRAFVIQSLESM